MELDVDTILKSHSQFSDDDNGGEDSVPHRSVDEILLNHSASSSPSPPSSPASSRPYDDVSASFQQTLNSSQSLGLLSYHSVDSKFSSITRIKSGEFASTSRNVPFSTVSRSNAKPGAALAAAAAASRLIPTPYAAAIKSRRASQKLLGALPFTSESTPAESEVASVGGSVGNVEVSSEIDVSENCSMCSLQSAQGDITTENVETTGCKQQGVVLTDAPSILDSDSSDKDENWEGSSDFLDETHLDAGTMMSEHLDVVEDPTCSNVDEANDEKFQPLLVDEDKHVGNELERTNELDHDEALGAYEEERPNGQLDASSQAEEESSQAKEESSQAKEDGARLEKDNLGLTKNEADLANELVSQPKDEGSTEKICKKPLELAEELEKQLAFSGMHWEEGAAAQPKRLDDLQKGSTMLGYFSVEANNAITHTISSHAFRRDHGSPQVLAVHLNYIAVGMSKGLTVLFPSKYSPHRSDNLDAKMMMLGLQGDRSHVPVTSMCFNQNGDLLFAGYGDGHCTVWDVHKASALKVITEHKAPVVHMLYLGQDSQVTRQFNVVTGDSKGVVKLISFSVYPLFNRISYTKSVLFNETTGMVLCASPLLSTENDGSPLMPSQGNNAVSAGGIGSMMRGAVGVEEGVVIFVTKTSALVAKVIPTVEVYAQLPRPNGVSDASMPYASWKWTAELHGSPTETSRKVPLLAIAWDRCVHVAKLIKSDLKVYGKWTLDSPAVGVVWLDDQMLVVLTVTGQLCLFGNDGSLIHQTTFAVDGSQGDDLISCHTYFSNISMNPQKAYHNCIAVRGATLYILGPFNLVLCRLLPWKERVEVLRKAGDGMGALSMAMSLYNGQAHGVIDLPKTLDDVQNTMMPFLVELILSYVDEVFSYISVACSNQRQSDESKDTSDYISPEIKEQYTRVGEVAVEFCVHIKRTDILFDKIYYKFVLAKQKETFLELLEPYILKDMLGALPAEIMQALVEHYSMKGWLQRVEQCVLHMHISSLDFNQVVRLCREHNLHGALIYLFNKGLNDFKAPLEELLSVLRNSERENAAAPGYKMLVYLKYCFQGLAFPPGQGNLSATSLPSVRKELVQFLSEESSAPDPVAVSSLPSVVCSNLHYLLKLDTEATLDVMRYAFDPTNLNMNTSEGNDVTPESENLVQKVVDILAVILDKAYFQNGGSISMAEGKTIDIWPTRIDVGHIFEFISSYIASERAKVAKDILCQILEYLISEVEFSSSSTGLTSATISERENKLVALLEVVPNEDWDAPYLLHLCERAQLHQVCGLIHAIRHQYIAALFSYMKAVAEPIHAFSYIHVMLQQLSDKEFEDFKSAVISCIPDLVRLSREGTLLLVVDQFSEQHQLILSGLHSHPESLFCFLKTLFEVQSTGSLCLTCLRKHNLGFPCGKRAKQRVDSYMNYLSDYQKILYNNPISVTDQMTEMYIELLCKYDRKSVRKFLETFESYRVEHCLHLCQEYRIVDAAAFLLERVGDVGSALLLILSELNEKFIQLDAAIASEFSDAAPQNFHVVLKKMEVRDILDVVHASIGLCQRNTLRLDLGESEYLWFRLLDSFCQPLMDSASPEMDLIGETHAEASDRSLDWQGDREACLVKWKILKSHKCANILRKLLAMFIKEIIDGMIGYVRLQNIMFKLLSHFGSQEFGDFKLTILGMLGTYNFERRILDSAKSLIEDDTYYTMSLLKKGASHGFALRSLQCCVCNGPFSKDSSTLGIQAFSCGHARHLQCEVQEKEALLRGSSAACPICMSRKSSQRLRNKAIVSENGLVSNYSSQSQQMHGTLPVHTRDNDVFDNNYVFHPISRFELLNNLQKNKKVSLTENLPQLRLAPPAVYHDKVKKGTDLLREESISGHSKIERTKRGKQLKDVKVKGSSLRLPLRSSIFGKEKLGRR